MGGRTKGRGLSFGGKLASVCCDEDAGSAALEVGKASKGEEGKCPGEEGCEVR